MKNLIVYYSTSIKESLSKLEQNKEKCLLVLSKNGTFLGTLTDGDIRRAIIKGANVDSKIFGTGKFYKEQEEKKENIYSDIDEMLSSTLKNDNDK